MTKRSFILSVVAVGMFSLVARSAGAALSETQKQEIRNVFTDQTIKITEENETVAVGFPEVTVQEEGASKKKVDAYRLDLKKAGSFNGMPQYKYVTVSPLRLKSLVYSRLGFWFPSVVTEAGSFAEEASVVPALGYESGRKMQITDLRLIDEEEGVSNEFLSASKISSFVQSKENGGGADYFSVFKGENIVISLALGNLRIPGFVSVNDMKNAVLKPGQKVPMLADNINGSLKTSVITLEVPMLSTVVNFRIDSEGRSVLNKEENTIDVVSLFRLRDVNSEGMLSDLPLNSFDLKFWVKGIDRQKYEKFLDEQQSNMSVLIEDKAGPDEMSADSDGDEAEPVEVSQENWRSLLIGKDVKYKFSVLFDRGSINGKGRLEIRKDDVLNVMKFEVVNFDVLSPDTGKACRERQAKNPSALPLRCPSGGFLDSLRPYLDVGKRVKNSKGETVDEFIVRQSGTESTINGKPFTTGVPSVPSAYMGL